MIDVIEIVKCSLNEKRKLTNEEIFRIIESILVYYQVRQYISDIRLDYKAKSGAFSNYDFQKNIVYFDLEAICLAILNNNANGDVDSKNAFSFCELLIIEQLRHVFKEVRHIIQKNSGFEDRTIIKEIINDSEFSKYSRDIYEDNYSLFPQVKDARVFSLEQIINFMKKCDYFNKNAFRIMYNEYFKALIKGYKLDNCYEGTLKDFYINVYGDIDKYYEVVSMADSLVTHDKMSFNLPLNEIDKKNILVVPDLIYRGHNPSLVLKNVVKRR